MSTNNLDLSGLVHQALAGDAPSGLPDVQELTKLANAYFSALPNQSAGVESLPTSIESLPTSQLTSAQVPNFTPAGVGDVSAINESALSALVQQSFALPGKADLVSSIKSPADFNQYSALSLPSASSFYFLNDVTEQGRDPILSGLGAAHPAFDVNLVRRDFPILQERVNGYPLAWLDNAATTQKPQVVIDRISEFYKHENSNIHRAAHELAARATDAYEEARNIVAKFINAGSVNEIVFVRGSTEAINLVAKSWGKQNISAGDEIIISWLEHHANIVPWQQLCAETGALLRVIPVDDQGQVILSEYQKLLNPRTKLVSFTHVSNALGTVTPAQEMIAMAHAVGARVLLDGAQSVSHIRVDVKTLDCDWLVFSGHKIFGPTGIGVVYGKQEVLDATQPWQGGGNMIEDVTFEKTVYQPAPAKFEAGTGNIADAVGLGAALQYLSKIGLENVARYEHELLVYGMQALQRIPGVTLIGTAPDKTSVLSFVLAGHSTMDVGKALNEKGIAVRAGHHCAQPILRRFGLESTVRPSLAFYNTYEEIDRMVGVVKHLQCRKVSFSH
ncbi:family 2A encapsulin nanocompartment cargo protein cysteine desulfurase [Methylomonas sp. AM2-LC]|uniref:family 2A encapsulin nanocompartment cargo protein cysteine desulfurase n=1 Tax=Methylomonas sp. AM2-LC TaxID=3153301 RepID=UPI0032632307